MRTIPAMTTTPRRPGFTLVELLIVISIMLLLAAITLVSVNFSYSRDRVRAGGRQLQSFLAGARDRAIYAKEVRGVRLILDPLNRHTAVAVQYVGAADRLTNDQIYFDALAEKIRIPDALRLQNLGLLRVGSQIEIPRDSGNLSIIASPVLSDGSVQLSRANPNYVGVTAGVSYALLLPPTPIPGSEPVPLPAGVVIDLDGSLVPAVWRPSLTNTSLGYSSTMDILFNPRGNVVGDVAGNGILHLLLADAGEALKWQSIQGRLLKANPSVADWSPPLVPANIDGAVGTPLVQSDQILVSLNGRTGNVGVYHVNPTNTSPADQVADDPYSLAETGQVAN